MGTADQWERGTATRLPITGICSPGVVELVRSNLAPDFPLFHGAGVNGETEHWPEREDTGGGAAALSTPAPSQRGDKCI